MTAEEIQIERRKDLERVRFFQEKRQGVKIMSSALDAMRDEYLQKGAVIHSIEVALRMIQSGRYADDEVAEMSGLPIEEVRKLKAGAAA